MGADFRDVDNDGKPDIWHTAVEHETFPFYLNRGKGNFADMTIRSGLAKPTGEMSGWGNGFADFDNDGWKDLFVARSNVMDNIQEAAPERRFPEPNSVFRNLGADKFEDVSATAGADLQRAAVNRGVAFGDLDNDGRMDMVVSILGGNAKLFHNITETKNHWILFKLTGTRSNRMGIGAQLRITTEDGRQQWNEVTTAVGYACASDSRVHFGLGENKRVKELTIRWPGGVEQTLRNLEADRVVTVEEPRE
jgi:hypothetical protein